MVASMAPSTNMSSGMSWRWNCMRLRNKFEDGEMVGFCQEGRYRSFGGLYMEWFTLFLITSPWVAKKCTI